MNIGLKFICVFFNFFKQYFIVFCVQVFQSLSYQVFCSFCNGINFFSNHSVMIYIYVNLHISFLCVGFISCYFVEFILSYISFGIFMVFLIHTRSYHLWSKIILILHFWLDAFISKSSLTTLSRTSNTMLNKSSTSRNPCLTNLLWFYRSVISKLKIMRNFTRQTLVSL